LDTLADIMQMERSGWLSVNGWLGRVGGGGSRDLL
jgi:hypothetical protein